MPRIRGINVYCEASDEKCMSVGRRSPCRRSCLSLSFRFPSDAIAEEWPGEERKVKSCSFDNSFQLRYLPIVRWWCGRHDTLFIRISQSKGDDRRNQLYLKAGSDVGSISLPSQWKKGVGYGDETDRYRMKNTRELSHSGYTRLPWRKLYLAEQNDIPLEQSILAISSRRPEAIISFYYRRHLKWNQKVMLAEDHRRWLFKTEAVCRMLDWLNERMSTIKQFFGIIFHRTFCLELSVQPLSPWIFF